MEENNRQHKNMSKPLWAGLSSQLSCCHKRPRAGGRAEQKQVAIPTTATASVWHHTLRGLCLHLAHWGQTLGLYLAAGACNLTTSPFLQPPRCHTRRFFQPAFLHPLQAVLLLLSTTDTHHISPWLGACLRHAESSLLPKTSSSSN